MTLSVYPQQTNPNLTWKHWDRIDSFHFQDGFVWTLRMGHFGLANVTYSLDPVLCLLDCIKHYITFCFSFTTVLCANCMRI